MFHERSGAHLLPPEPHFRWRGGEITRLEAFSDAVFAFAVTLLVVSLEVPHTFDELIVAMKGFAAFAICFATLVQVWYYHYIYSRRYGLQTIYTIVLNATLLFVVLFYVYPLKFLFTLVIGGLTGVTVPQEQMNRMITSQHQVPVLMVIYSVGVIAVFTLFALLYRYAYQKRTELELNEYEALSTRNAVIHFSGFAGVALIVAVVAVLVPEKYAGAAGLLFCLNGIWGWIAGSMLGRQERLALEKMPTRTGSGPSSTAS
ncbi:MAG TPA: TMEM175 family protein [Alphaproteobacteria bacterium]|nr:TMEM175 family protein [Alphaproteobacteria bacterium]